MIQSRFQFTYYTFVFTLFSFTATILLLYKYFRIPPRNTRVCLEITTGLPCEIIEVLPIVFQYNVPKFHRKHHNYGSLLPKLTVKWPNFRCIINVSTDHTINVPAKIAITPFQAYRLRAILEESYCAHILILHHDIKSPILPTLDNAISIPTAPQRDMQLNKRIQALLVAFNPSLIIYIYIYNVLLCIIILCHIFYHV